MRMSDRTLGVDEESNENPRLLLRTLLFHLLTWITAEEQELLLAAKISFGSN